MPDILKRLGNKTFCALPFIHQHQGVLKKNYLCCDSSLPIDDVFDEHSDSLRQQIWNGQPIPHCDNCYQLEATGQISPRQKHTVRWLKDPAVKQYLTNWQAGQLPDIVSYDVRADNTCNLGCVMCWYGASSLWARELGMPASEPVVLNHHKMLNAKYVYLAGGEPFLINECLKLISAIADQTQQPELVINTNLTSVSDQTFEQLARIQNLTLVVSVDAAGTVNEYHRWPLSWTKFMRNLNRAHELIGSTRIMFNTVIDAVSVFGLGELAQLDSRAGLWNIENLVMPADLQLQNIPDQLKPLAHDQLTQIKTSQFYSKDMSFKRVIDHAVTQLKETGQPDLLRGYINNIDQRRKINHQDYLGVNFNV
jgi:sulfatase maturation enzyme AslB (radical SAM superfamily)